MYSPTMTKFSRTDWLRDLLKAGTKWTHGFSGQVPWNSLSNFKDPNNGARFTIGQLENHLTDVLRKCTFNNQVPLEYKPEVEYFMECIKQRKKYTGKVVSNIAKTRKIAISLFEISQSFVNLNKDEKDLIMEKIRVEIDDTLYGLVLEIRSTATSAVVPGVVAPQVEDNRKIFKLDDWMRHMYLCCQKWINGTEGRHQWKSAKDPNNDKKGPRMKKEEVKQSLLKLTPLCVQHNVVPRLYKAEIEEVLRVANECSQFCAKELEVKEKLRQIAVSLIEVIKSTEGHVEEVLKIMGPSKIFQVYNGIGQLEDMLKEGRAQEHLDKEPTSTEGIHIEPLQDGTDILMDILDQAQSPVASMAIVQSDYKERFPPSPSLGFSEILSEVSSPLSQDTMTMSPDGYISDDSGISSPNNYGDQDLELMADLKFPLEFDEDDILKEFDAEDLDTSQLPDVKPYINNTDGCESDCFPSKRDAQLKRKRKLTTTDFDKPAKKSRP